MGRAEGKWDGGVRQVQRQGWDENLFVIFLLCFKIYAQNAQN